MAADKGTKIIIEAKQTKKFSLMTEIELKLDPKIVVREI